MGNIRPERVKRPARELLKRFYDRFTTDFEHNKKVLVEIVEIRSKKLRNQIAGYITHLKKLEEKGIITISR